MQKELSYSDVYMLPNKSIVESRSECDINVELGDFNFKSPVYPANMKSVVNQDTCKFFAKRGWFYTMHRFNINLNDFMKSMIDDSIFTSISVGVNKDSYDQLNELKSKNLLPDFITIDIANAWCKKAELMTKWIRENFPKSFLIVGNVSSFGAVADLQSWGAQAIKLGQAGGSVCSTKNKTGFYRPMASTLIECRGASKVPIIADGGIKEHGDIAKAIGLGATMVMAGNLFAGYDESAGQLIQIDNRWYKEYFGSASSYNKQIEKNIEGKKILIEYKGSISRLLDEIQEDLQSSISYSGGNCLQHLKRTKFILA